MTQPNQFYITIPSSTRLEGNKTGDFRAILPHPIELTGEWQIGLAEFQFPLTYFTIRDCHLIVKFRDDQVPDKLNIPDGYYETPQKLLQILETTTQAYCGLKLKERGGLTEPSFDYYIRFEYLDIRKRMRLFISKPDVEYVELDDRLRHALGFGEARIMNSAHMGAYTVDCSAGLSSLFVYCSLIEPQYVGDSLTQLLKVIPVRGEADTVQSIDFPMIHYYNLLCNRFSDVSISVKSSDGQTVPFNYGQIIVKLHLRRKKLFM